MTPSQYREISNKLEQILVLVNDLTGFDLINSNRFNESWTSIKTRNVVKEELLKKLESEKKEITELEYEGFTEFTDKGQKLIKLLEIIIDCL